MSDDEWQPGGTLQSVSVTLGRNYVRQVDHSQEVRTTKPKTSRDIRSGYRSRRIGCQPELFVAVAAVEIPSYFLRHSEGEV